MNALETTIIEHSFLKTMQRDHVEHLLKNAREKEFNRGEILFRAGEPANKFFLVQSGKIALETRNPRAAAPFYIVGEGDVLGWSWLFPPFCWHFQARALEPTHVIALDGAHLLVTAEEDPEFGYQLMKRIAKIVIQRLQTMV
jgi:CRP/FNR family transcriptional regulator, cyclic AMP receptor protein